MWNRLKVISSIMRLFALPAIVGGGGIVIAVLSFYDLYATRTLTNIIIMFAVMQVVSRFVNPKTEFAKLLVVVALRYLNKNGLSLSRKAETRLSMAALLAQEKGRESSICTLIIVGLFVAKWFEAGFLETISDWGIILVHLAGSGDPVGA